MTVSKQNVIAILLVVAAVVITLLLVTLSRKHPVNEEAIVNREKVKSLQRELVLKDSLYNVRIAGLDSINAILTDKITINKIAVNQSNERIKTLPARSASMPIDEVISTIEQ